MWLGVATACRTKCGAAHGICSHRTVRPAPFSCSMQDSVDRMPSRTSRAAWGCRTHASPPRWPRASRGSRSFVCTLTRRLAVRRSIATARWRSRTSSRRRKNRCAKVNHSTTRIAMSTDKFIPTPAGTPIAAPTSVQSFMRRQVFPRAPVTNDSWSGGREAHFSYRASGTDCFVATQSRLVLRMHVRSNIVEVARFPGLQRDGWSCDGVWAAGDAAGRGNRRNRRGTGLGVDGAWCGRLRRLN